MTTILIADACKPSVVMTSEIFKDRITGVVVHIAHTGQETLDKLEHLKPDLCIIDFDLPDVDGPALVEAIRRLYDGPVLMTAFPDAVVREAVDVHLFTCEDASGWLSKPLKQDDIVAAIDQFIVKCHRIERRFFAREVPTQLVAKAAGRGKRAPKVTGKVHNISLGGACIKLDGLLKLKKQQELTMAVSFPAELPPMVVAAPEKAAVKGAKAKASRIARPKGLPKKVKEQLPETFDLKFRAKVAWAAPTGLVGIEFCKLTDVQRKGLMTYLRLTYDSSSAEAV
jgi:CheY-like chemotaxis protein